MSVRIHIATAAGSTASRSFTRKARVAGVEMLLVAALGVASWVAGPLPLNMFTAAPLALLVTLGCLLVGWPELLVGRVRAPGPGWCQAHIRHAQTQAIREHFADDLTMPPTGDPSARDKDQSG